MKKFWKEILGAILEKKCWSFFRTGSWKSFRNSSRRSFRSIFWRRFFWWNFRINFWNRFLEKILKENLEESEKIWIKKSIYFMEELPRKLLKEFLSVLFYNTRKKSTNFPIVVLDTFTNEVSEILRNDLLQNLSQ